MQKKYDWQDNLLYVVVKWGSIIFVAAILGFFVYQIFRNFWSILIYIIMMSMGFMLKKWWRNRKKV